MRCVSAYITSGFQGPRFQAALGRLADACVGGGFGQLQQRKGKVDGHSLQVSLFLFERRSGYDRRSKLDTQGARSETYVVVQQPDGVMCSFKSKFENEVALWA